MTRVYQPRYETERIDMDRCRAGVYHKTGNWGRTEQCSLKAITEADADGNRWCGIHSPIAETQRRERSDAYYAKARRIHESDALRTNRERDALALMPAVLTYLRQLRGGEFPDPDLQALIAAITPLVEVAP